MIKLLILPGDGIGPEVTSAAVKIIQTAADALGLAIEFSYGKIGAEAIFETGSPLPDETIEKISASDAVFLGAVGDPRCDNLEPEKRPEAGLLRLRALTGGFVNLRPARAYSALLEASPLKREIFEGTDLLIVRELLGGLYFGDPRGFESAADWQNNPALSKSGDSANPKATGQTPGGRRAFNTMAYTTSEIERIAHFAFRLARDRRKFVTSVDKANVLEVSQLWRATVSEVAKSYPDVTLEHLYVDACAMHLVTRPKRFDVILTENLFGDILSDEAAVLTGSLGMLPSATLGGKTAIYEPVHGSAPDIAGHNKANPIGAIASAAMFFRHTLENELAARSIELAIEQALSSGLKTADIAINGNFCTTDEMAEQIGQFMIENLKAKEAAGTSSN
jgi:3-isopropylmalate dehydrogenase